MDSDDFYTVRLRKKDRTVDTITLPKDSALVRGEKGGFGVVPRWAIGKRREFK
jgi:hypothetical protein